MYARALDDAARRLRKLRHEEREDLALGALALGLAVAATQLSAALAAGLFLGGVFIGASGLRALWRRWDLVDRLSDESDAYAIVEVHRYASRHATMKSRRGFARAIRGFVLPQSYYTPPPAGAARELNALAGDLDDPGLALDPDRAVICKRMLDDLAQRRALDAVSWEDVRAQVRRIRAGFQPRGGNMPASTLVSTRVRHRR